RAGDEGGQRQYSDRGSAEGADRCAQLDLHYPWAQSSDVRRRDDIPRAGVQGGARWSRAWRDWQVRPVAETVFGRACARLPIGNRSVRGRDVKLACAEADSACGEIR